MIEQKLQAAANVLPEPRGNFPAVEERIKHKQRTKSRPRKRLVAALLLVVLLVGCVAVTAPDYHLYNGTLHGYSPAEDTQKEADKLGIILPETLGGYPVIAYNRYNLTNQEVPIWWAWLSPRYVYHSSFYGMEIEEPWVDPNGTEGIRIRREGAEITCGPTDDTIWRRQFGYDENDVFVAGNWMLAHHPVVGITSQEYQGITIYIGQIELSLLEHPQWDVTWVDYDKGVVFCIATDAENPDTLIGYAKQIIDLNK